MKNLPQFRDRSHEEVREYTLAKRRVDIGDNFNFGSTILWVFAMLAIFARVIGIWKWYKGKTQDKKCIDENMDAPNFSYRYN